MEIIKNENESVEEILEDQLAEEKSLTAEISEDDLKSKLVEQYSLNPEDEKDSALLEKLVEDKKNVNKTLTKVIGQKIKYRDLATKSKPDSKDPKKDVKNELSETDMLKKVDERFEENHLRSLGISDELMKETKDYAKLKGLSLLQAYSSPYISFEKEKADKQAKIDKASNSFSHKSSPTKRDFSGMSPKDFDLNSEQGQKDFKEYKVWLKTQ